MLNSYKIKSIKNPIPIKPPVPPMLLRRQKMPIIKQQHQAKIQRSNTKKMYAHLPNTGIMSYDFAMSLNRRREDIPVFSSDDDDDDGEEEEEEKEHNRVHHTTNGAQSVTKSK